LSFLDEDFELVSSIKSDENKNHATCSTSQDGSTSEGTTATSTSTASEIEEDYRRQSVVEKTQRERMTRKEALLRFTIARQSKVDGCFTADSWGEAEPRFVYAAFGICTILDCMHRIDVDSACDYLRSCYNLDGGFGSRPGSESHAAYTWYLTRK